MVGSSQRVPRLEADRNGHGGRAQHHTQCQDPVSRGRVGAIAQLGERLLCKQEVVGSIPSGSTRPEITRPQRAKARALPWTALSGRHDGRCDVQRRRVPLPLRQRGGLLDIVKKGYAPGAGPPGPPPSQDIAARQRV